MGAEREVDRGSRGLKRQVEARGKRLPLAPFAAAALALLLAGGAAVAPAWAADPPAAASAEAEPTAPPASDERKAGLEILAEINETLARFAVLNKELDGVFGEEHLVVLGQIGRVELEVIAELDTLADHVEAMKSAGLEVDPAVAVYLRDEFPKVTGYIKRTIEESQHVLADIARRREELTPDRLLDHEAKLSDQNARVDHYYEILLLHASRVERFGEDGTMVRRHVTRLLGQRADRLEGRVELTLKQISDLKLRAQENPDDKVVAAELRAAQAKRQWTTRSLTSAANLLDRLEISTAAYRRLLIRASGTLTQDIFDTEVALGLVEESWERARSWALENGPGLLFRLFFFLAIVLMFRLLSIVVRRVVHRAIRVSGMRASTLLQEILASLGANLVFALGVLFGLSQLGVEIGPLLAGIGIAGFIVGFALQDALANFAAGAMLLIYRPYDVDDIIEAAGVLGRVDHMSLVSTTILTFDNQTLVVPNNKIWGDVIRNITTQEHRRVDLMFRVGLGDDVARIESILGAIVADHPKVLDDPEVTIKLDKLADFWMEFVVRPWVQREDYWEVYWDLTREVKTRFDEEKITIPVPKTDVQIVEATGR